MFTIVAPDSRVPRSSSRFAPSAPGAASPSSLKCPDGSPRIWMLNAAWWVEPALCAGPHQLATLIRHRRQRRISVGARRPPVTSAGRVSGSSRMPRGEIKSGCRHRASCLLSGSGRWRGVRRFGEGYFFEAVCPDVRRSAQTSCATAMRCWPTRYGAPPPVVHGVPTAPTPGRRHLIIRTAACGKVQLCRSCH
jgi:hypothetical protein